jgi:regulator of sirC expression with transglutaminase-like and TPR domain
MVMLIENKIIIIDGASQDVVEREMTQEELTELNSQQVNPEEQIADVQSKEASRQAILDRLGLTAEEAQLLLGGN